MFDPNHAGISGTFYCADGALFIRPQHEHLTRHVMPAMQGLAVRCKNTLHFPYLLCETDGEPIIGVPDGKEKCLAEEQAKILGIPDGAIQFEVASAVLDSERTTSMIGLLFSGAWKIYSHLCTLSYAYYQINYTLVPDEFYDQLWKAFDHRYSQTPAVLRDHPHFKLLRYADIEGGSFHRVPKWPLWIENATEIYTRQTRTYTE